MEKGAQKTMADFANWLDTKLGKSGITPLHIASYKGRPDAIRKLISSGARISIMSTFGMNVIHFAAQGNQPWPIAYFYEHYHMNLDEKDVDGNTPLHWACHFGSAVAAEFLLKWSASLNEKNNAGHTPLHFAVEIAIDSECTRLVRVLLFAGAERHAEDNRGRMPMEIVRVAENEAQHDPEIITELKRLLAEPKGCACLTLKIPVKKTEPNPKMIFFFLFFHLFCQFVIFTIALPRILQIITIL